MKRFRKANNKWTKIALVMGLLLVGFLVTKTGTADTTFGTPPPSTGQNAVPLQEARKQALFTLVSGPSIDSAGVTNPAELNSVLRAYQQYVDASPGTVDPTVADMVAGTMKSKAMARPGLSTGSAAAGTYANAAYDNTKRLLNNQNCRSQVATSGSDVIPDCVNQTANQNLGALSNYWGSTTDTSTPQGQQLLNQQQSNIAMQQAANTANTKGSQPTQEIYCFKWTEGFSVPGCIAIGSYEVLYLTSWVLWVAALVFDVSIKYSLSMQSVFADFGTIQNIWTILRNFVNLLFILILVYISIATILRLENYGYKKLLGKLVIVAVLINFSLFFAEIIIDVSNFTTLVFYKHIMDDAKGKADANVSATRGLDAKDQYLSLAIINALGMQQIWGADNNSSVGTGSSTGAGIGNSSNNTASNNPAVENGNAIVADGGGTGALNPWSMTLVGLGGSIFILILSFIFIAAAFMFLIRLCFLIILIILSPLAFGAMILPQTQSQASRWWKSLISNALFAPVYMMLMYASLQMLWAPMFKGKTGSILRMFANQEAGGASSVMFFFIICFMLIMCLVVASSLGASGAKTFQKWGTNAAIKTRDWSKNFAVNRVTAPVSAVADKVSRSQYFGKMAGGNNAFGRFIGSRTLQAADKLAQSKLGGSSSYRDRVKSGQKSVEARAKLAETTLKKQPGETDNEYYARTGYVVGTLKPKSDETADAYKARTGIDKAKYKDGDTAMKMAVARATGVRTKKDETGTEVVDGVGFSIFRGKRLAAGAKADEMSKKARELKSSPGEKRKGELDKLVKVEQIIDDPTTSASHVERKGELPEMIKSIVDEDLRNEAEEIMDGITEANRDVEAEKIRVIFDKQHEKMIVKRRGFDEELEGLAEEAKNAEDKASGATTSELTRFAAEAEEAEAFAAAAGSTEEAKLAATAARNIYTRAAEGAKLAATAAQNNHTRKTSEYTRLQANIDDIDKIKSSLATKLSRIEDLGVSQNQLDAVAGINKDSGGAGATPPAAPKA